jgi:hypothetical protein
VPALDHPRPGRAEPEDRPAPGDGVEPGRGLGEQRGCPRVDGQDRRSDLDPFGARGQVAQIVGASKPYASDTQTMSSPARSQPATSSAAARGSPAYAIEADSRIARSFLVFDI